uniref:HECT E3 ubiquitin ligase putative n=1 Tax=Albugo laibachii Nc14 TaxID=890382 RepID=F0WPI9_9STRA|nr:HECT E3 ubiquitin ligase putative [Albugo laibachii Nc14]|eukprot:CCA23237.1 HECT E3 ubiquitin ligase putative [Albugo laibachii Nc14]
MSNSENPLSQLRAELGTQSEMQTEDFWSCGTCTFQNESYLQYCEMCSTPRPRAPAATCVENDSTISARRAQKRKRKFLSETWECRSCWLIQPNNADVCSCGNAKVSTKEDDEELEEDENGEDRKEGDDHEYLWLNESEDSSIDEKNFATDCESTPKRKPISSENSYGISSELLQKTMEQGDNEKVASYLRALTHTLAIIEASHDSSWRDNLLLGSGNFINPGFGSLLFRKSRDSALIATLLDIYETYRIKQLDDCHSEPKSTTTSNKVVTTALQLQAIQSVNYLLKIELAAVDRDVLIRVSKNYMKYLLTMKLQSSDDLYRQEMSLVEEMIAGLGWMSHVDERVVEWIISTPLKPNYDSVLYAFLDILANMLETTKFHANVLETTLSIIQKCVFKLHWKEESAKITTQTGSPTKTKQINHMTQHLAIKVISILETCLAPANSTLHIRAVKCFLCLLYRIPKYLPAVFTTLVTKQMLKSYVNRAVDVESSENHETKHALLSLLYHLFDNCAEFMVIFVKKKLYKKYLKGMKMLFGSPVPTKERSSPTRAVTMTSNVNDSTRDTDTLKLAMLKILRLLLQTICDDGEKAHGVYHAWHPLLMECIRSDLLIGVRALLGEGFESNSTDPESPLCVAVQHASMDLVRFLVGQGADVRACSLSGTPLHIAVRLGRCDVVAFLLECGADMHTKDRHGVSVVDELKRTQLKKSSPVRLYLESIMAKDSSCDFDKIGAWSGKWMQQLLDKTDDSDSESSSGVDDEEAFDDDMDCVEEETKDGLLYMEELDDMDSESEDESSFHPFSTEQKPKQIQKFAIASGDRFLRALLEAFLDILQNDVMHLSHGVVSTLALIFENIPSALAQQLGDFKSAILLDAVHCLLQDALQAISPSFSSGTLETNSQEQTRICRKMLCALRILDTILSKSAIFLSYAELDRRDLFDQINSCKTVLNKHTQSPFPICDRLLARMRGFKQRTSARTHTLVHLVTQLQAPTSADAAIAALVELLDHSASITLYEFAHFNLLDAILSYLCGLEQKQVDKERLQVLFQALERYPMAFQRLIQCLQHIVNENRLPVLLAHERDRSSGRNKSLQSLTRSLSLSVTRFPSNTLGIATVKSCESFQVTPLTQFRAFERVLLQTFPVTNGKLMWLYMSLVGRRIWRLEQNGKWQLHMVLGYDPQRDVHLLVPLDLQNTGFQAIALCKRRKRRKRKAVMTQAIASDTSNVRWEGITETTLHDGLWKLSDAITVREDRWINVNVYHNCSSSKKRNRDSAVSKHQSDAEHVWLVPHPSRGLMSATALASTVCGKRSDTNACVEVAIPYQDSNGAISFQTQVLQVASCQIVWPVPHANVLNVTSQRRIGEVSWMSIDNEPREWKCFLAPRVSVKLRLMQQAPLSSHNYSTDTKNQKPWLEALMYSTQDIKKHEWHPNVRKALLDTFESNLTSCEQSSISKKQRRRKRRKGIAGPEKSSWDVTMVTDFLTKLLGSTLQLEWQQRVWIQFAAHAEAVGHRERLTADGFLALIRSLCMHKRIAHALLHYLRSRYGDRFKEPQASAPTCEEMTSDFQSFEADQCVLQCLQLLKGQHGPDDSAIAPWTLSSRLQIQHVVIWPEESRDHSTRYQIDRSQWSSCTTSDGVRRAMQLLKILHEKSQRSRVLRTSVLVAEAWTNTNLCEKVHRQLENVFGLATMTYPSWCVELLYHYRFLFSRDLREAWFRATAFGAIRCLNWYREHFLRVEDVSESQQPTHLIWDAALNEDFPPSEWLNEHAGIDVSLEKKTDAQTRSLCEILTALFSIKSRQEEDESLDIALVPLPRERVRITRDDIMEMANKTLRGHSKRRAIMEVAFVGEKGYGAGVTAEFYSIFSQALQSKDIGAMLWVRGDEQDDSEYIRHPNGLFPVPHRTVSAFVIECFSTIGRLTGKALMDERLLPLPVSQDFIRLAVYGESFSVDQVDSVFGHAGRTLKLLHDFVHGKKQTLNGMQGEKWLDMACLSFVDPLSQQELIPDGTNVQLTIDNLPNYVTLVLQLWLDAGIRPQIEAFQRGLSEISSIEKLGVLSVEEFRGVLCGNADIEWDAALLTSSFKLSHGYTKDSPTIHYFVQVLEEMSMDQRRELLLYATGCPNLPVGGIACLQPRLEVIQRIVDRQLVDQALPFARTCTNTFHLPAYTSKAVLAERLTYAIENSRGMIDRD